jgi:acyl dehydratase
MTEEDGRLRFEDIAEGLAWETPGITVTEGHILAFAGLSGDFYEIHVDDDYARALGYPGRVAHGILGLALALHRTDPRRRPRACAQPRGRETGDAACGPGDRHA